MIVPQPAPNDNNNGEATDVRRSTRLRRPPVQYWDLDSQQSPSSALITTLDDSEPLYALAVNHAINAETSHLQRCNEAQQCSIMDASR